LTNIVSLLEKMKVKPPIPSDVLDYAVRYWFVDNSKAKKELGYQPKHDFDNYLEQTVKWYADNQNWWKKIKYAR